MTPGRVRSASAGAERFARSLPIGRLAALCGLVLAAVLAAQAVAQTPFPSKPLRIVVPFGAGGVADLTTRSVAEHLSKTLKQPVVVDNKPGAGGVVAAESVARADADGHTLLLMSNANAISHTLFRKLPYDTVRDFAPIGLIGTFDLVIVTPSKARFATFDDMLRFARANPGKLNIGTINIGSTQHLSAELFKSTFGVNAQVVPFNGTPAVISALRGNQVDVAFEILGPMLAQIQSGAVHALAVTGSARDPALPDTRTVSEHGYGRFEVSSWNALAAPARTPPAIVTQLNQALNAALADPAVVRRLRDLHVSPKPGAPDAASRTLQSELPRWGDVIIKAGIPRE